MFYLIKMMEGSIVAVLMILLSVVFMSLLEQKILAVLQLRMGPEKNSLMGLGQPLGDAIKLFGKGVGCLSNSNKILYYFSPFLGLVVSLMLWVVVPFEGGNISLSLDMLYFMCVSGLMPYVILLLGWSSSSKYSFLGSLRSLSQMLSYEISMSFIVLSFILVSYSFKFLDLLSNNWMYFIMWPMMLGWFICLLGEGNRSPFDLVEAESELVSGFNTEYSGGSGFSIIFMTEYSNMMLMSLLFWIVFGYFKSVDVILILMSVMLLFLFVWVRGSLPRFRYDQFMYFMWSILLVSILSVFSNMYMTLGCFL